MTTIRKSRLSNSVAVETVQICLRRTEAGRSERTTSMFFWMTGLLSSFLDNAPTYLVFFNTAGGNAAQLMADGDVLAAISAGAVFMGANTYIGNAPNFMVKSMSDENGITMPSFFGYMKWSICILIPVFIIDALIFFI